MDSSSREYRQLYEKIKIIKNKMYDLEEQRKVLINTLKEDFLVNDDIVFLDEFENMKTNNNQIINELTNTIMPNINNKI